MARPGRLGQAPNRCAMPQQPKTRCNANEHIYAGERSARSEAPIPVARPGGGSCEQCCCAGGVQNREGTAVGGTHPRGRGLGSSSVVARGLDSCWPGGCPPASDGKLQSARAVRSRQARAIRRVRDRTQRHCKARFNWGCDSLHFLETATECASCWFVSRCVPACNAPSRDALLRGPGFGLAALCRGKFCGAKSAGQKTLVRESGS